MKKFYIILITALTSSIAFATVGTETGGGGDPCDNQIEIVRDDIKSWIKQNGGKELVLPSNISYEYYVNGMLDMINRSHLSCTSNSLVVAGAEKTCVNNFDKKGLPYIVCNRNLIDNMNIDDLYVLTHHEYAGLAKVENNVGADSDYSVSNQISAFLEEKITKKLAIKKKPHTPDSAHAYNYLKCSWTAYYTNSKELCNVYETKILNGKAKLEPTIDCQGLKDEGDGKREGIAAVQVTKSEKKYKLEMAFVDAWGGGNLQTKSTYAKTIKQKFDLYPTHGGLPAILECELIRK